MYSYSHPNNLVFNDSESESAITESVGLFRSAGGGAIVDNSTFGLSRRTSFLKDVSLNTGVHVIAGTGFYVQQSLSKEPS
jgi:phosphotriesterase-related protein